VLEVEVGGGFRGEAEFILIQADGGIVNAFDRTILASDPNLVFGQPVYTPNQVRISVDVSGYSDNQWATSQAITGLSGAGIDQDLIDEIESLDLQSYLSAMDQLGPEAYDAHTQATFELGHRFVQLMLERPRFCVAGSGEARTDPRTDLPCREHTFDPWITSYGQFSRRDGSPGHISSEDNAGGLVLGFDRYLNDRLVISGTLGTAYDSIRVDQVGPGSFTTLDLGLYAGYRRGPLRLQAVASYGHSWQERFRNIAIGDFSGQTMGQYGVDRLGVRAEVEYGIEAGAFLLAPLISLDYTTLLQSAITETGGGAAALTVPSRTDTARTLRVGFDLSTILHKKDYWTTFLENADGVWRPTLSLRWRQPLGDESRTVTARFTAADPNDLFSVQGDDSGQGFELGVGVDWTPLVADRLTFSLRYDGFFWQDVTSSAIIGRIRLSF
jgi:outer membrane autotransporter protein